MTSNKRYSTISPSRVS